MFFMSFYHGSMPRNHNGSVWVTGKWNGWETRKWIKRSNAERGGSPFVLAIL